MNDPACVRLSARIPERGGRLDQSRFAPPKVRLTGIEQRLDSFMRSEEFYSPEQTQPGDLTFTAESMERLIEPDRDSMRGKRTDIDESDVKQAVVEAEIDDNVRDARFLIGR